MSTDIAKILNVGTGAGLVFKQENAGNQAELKTIKAGSNVTVTNNADDITIASTGGGVTTMVWEDTFHANSLASNTGTNQIVYLSTLNNSFRGWEVAQFNKIGVIHSMHEGYAGGTIQARLMWFYDTNVASADAQSFRLQGRWFANDADLDVAFTNFVDFSGTPTAGAKRLIVTGLSNFSPDGSWAAANALMIALTRLDNNSDAPSWCLLKLRYTINL